MKDFMKQVEKMFAKAAIQNAVNDVSRNLEKALFADLGITVRMQTQVIDVDVDKLKSARSKGEKANAATLDCGDDDDKEVINRILGIFKIDGDDDDGEE